MKEKKLCIYEIETKPILEKKKHMQFSMPSRIAFVAAVGY